MWSSTPQSASQPYSLGIKPDTSQQNLRPPAWRAPRQFHLSVSFPALPPLLSPAHHCSIKNLEKLTDCLTGWGTQLAQRASNGSGVRGPRTGSRAENMLCLAHAVFFKGKIKPILEKHGISLKIQTASFSSEMRRIKKYL